MTVRLGETLPVITGYSTAVVRDGRVHFLPDIYGYDAALGEALQRRSAAAWRSCAVAQTWDRIR